jgi:hypothetical protein
MQKLKSKVEMQTLVDDASIFLLRYPEPRKVPTNPRWCPYTKGSPREGQAPRSSNSIESHGPSPCALVLRFRLLSDAPRRLHYRASC